MENTSYIALSRQTALRRRLDVIANNIANMGTTGFKAEATMMIENEVQPKRNGMVLLNAPKLHFVVDYASVRNTTQGAITPTQNPLDMALQGPGYFAIGGPDGEEQYSRAGRFHLNNERQIVDRNEFPLLGQTGQGITIPVGNSQIDIAGDGTVSTESGIIDRVKVVEFEDEQKLQQTQGGLYRKLEDQETMPANKTGVIQAAIEEANVQPVVEMTEMIDVLRQYQATQRIVETEHERIRTAIQRMSQLS